MSEYAQLTNPFASDMTPITNALACISAQVLPTYSMHGAYRSVTRHCSSLVVFEPISPFLFLVRAHPSVARPQPIEKKHEV